jgi:predicted DNA-binding transcriptional regulator YafY
VKEALRLNRYKELLSSRRAISGKALRDDMGISLATFKRDLQLLRDEFGWVIRHDRDLDGYILESDGDVELPGLRFDDQELLALVTIQHLLAELAPGILGPKLRPLQQRLEVLMARHGLAGKDIASRIRLVHAGQRRLKPQHFEAVAAATLARRRLHVRHFNRERGDFTDRDISPQRLVHYRDNWYVDAWCHLRNDVRSFSVDALEDVKVLEDAAKEMTPADLDKQLGAGYGIFGGAPKAWAVLRFTPERARWVRREQWHPQQEGRDLDDGGYELRVPYADDREIVGDILRFGAGVRVIEPPALKRHVQQALLAAAAAYV